MLLKTCRIVVAGMLCIFAAEESSALPSWVSQSRIIKVTNLNDSGAGSFRACVDGTGKRVCVFDVGGRIRLKSTLRAKNPFLYVAGQTAPEPGIIYSEASFRVQTSNVYVEHIQCLFGDKLSVKDPSNSGCLAIGGTSANPAANVTVDHVSLEWGIDENFSTWGVSKNITLSNSIIAEALDCSVHPKNECHSKGVLIGYDTKEVRLVGNLLASNFDRNPEIQPGSTGTIMNNVVYNWGPNSAWDCLNVSDSQSTKKATLLNILGNIYVPGIASFQRDPCVFALKPAPGTRLYLGANLGPNRWTMDAPEWAFSSLPQNPHKSLVPVVTLPDIKPMSPDETLRSVLASAGMRPKKRNAVDSRIISEVINSKGSIKDCVTGCSRSAGGWPSIPLTKRVLALPKITSSVTGWLDGFRRDVQ